MEPVEGTVKFQERECAPCAWSIPVVWCRGRKLIVRKLDAIVEVAVIQVARFGEDVVEKNFVVETDECGVVEFTALV
jgi:hypothetical protein